MDSSDGGGIFIKYMSIDDLLDRRRADNPKLHALDDLGASISRFGWVGSVLIDDEEMGGSGDLLAGHGRLKAITRRRDSGALPPARVVVRDGVWHVPVTRGVSFNSHEEATAYLLADNQLTIAGGYDEKKLIEVARKNLADLGTLEGTGFKVSDLDDIEERYKASLNDLGGDIGGGDDGDDGGSDDDATRRVSNNAMAAEFIFPPFSVIDTRRGTWLERKRKWLTLGLASDKGRKEGLTITGLGSDDVSRMMREQNTTSIFDPVLCELLYRWFTGPGGTILDPFAGGSVRGVVASILGRHYTGVDLRQEQVDANVEQAGEILTSDAIQPTWICADSTTIPTCLPGDPDPVDFVFSCPPYGHLEVYSDEDEDLSNMSPDDFHDTYRDIIAKACGQLADNRFACFIVGDYRHKDGTMANFVSVTIAAFIDAGLSLYNEVVLINMIGSLPLRAGRPFRKSRKIGKHHQNVLVFVKGDPKRAVEHIGPVDIGDLSVYMAGDGDDTTEEEEA